MTENNIKPEDDWRLQKIELEFQTYGPDKGKYAGSIHFKNGDYEGFNFKIRPDMAEPYIDLIALDIVKAAEQLGERIMQSLKVRDRI